MRQDNPLMELRLWAVCAGGQDMAEKAAHPEGNPALPSSTGSVPVHVTEASPG